MPESLSVTLTEIFTNGRPVMASPCGLSVEALIMILLSVGGVLSKTVDREVLVAETFPVRSLAQTENVFGPSPVAIVVEYEVEGLHVCQAPSESRGLEPVLMRI